jgi:hypothetical protein
MAWYPTAQHSHSTICLVHLRQAGDLYGMAKGGYARISSWPIVSLYARTGEYIFDAG